MNTARALRLALPALLIGTAVAAIRLADGGDTVERDGLTFAAGDLADALGRPGDSPGMRTVSTFASRGVPCRAFIAGELSGIACRERGGWHLRLMRSGVSLDDPMSLAESEAALRGAAAEMSAQ